jgi:hypothetical protein
MGGIDARGEERQRPALRRLGEEKKRDSTYGGIGLEVDKAEVRSTSSANR